MRRPLTAWAGLLTALLSLPAGAGSDGLAALGLQRSGAMGCQLAVGDTPAGATLSLLVALYGQHPELPERQIAGLIRSAVAAGCDLQVTDASWLSPLNAAILFNQPELVELLLSLGALPQARIASQKASINGLDSLQFARHIQRADDRSQIIRLLSARCPECAD